MKKSYEKVWRTKIPKKLYNKISYFLKQTSVPRSYFLNMGIDAIVIKYRFHHDEFVPDPENLYRFCEEDEANLVTWQVAVDKSKAQAYEDCMATYGVSGRDVLAAALYQNWGYKL